MSDSPTFRPVSMSSFASTASGKPSTSSSSGFPPDDDLLADDLFGPIDDQPMEPPLDDDDGVLVGFPGRSGATNANSSSSSSSTTSGSGTGMTHSTSLSSFPDFSGDPASASQMIQQQQTSQDQHRQTLSMTAAAHLSHCIHHLLVAHRIPAAWYSTLHSLIQQAVTTVRPDLRKGDLMDIRPYVKVQAIPGGKKSDSAYVDGLVFQHSLPTPSTLPRQSIDSPRILLFSGSIEGPQKPAEHRFLSSILDFGGAEKEWLDKRLPSVLFLRPDIIFVERGVSKGVYEALRGAGVGVVTGVELPVLERIARCTRATVLPALDVVEGRYMGTCGQLRVEEFGLVIDEHEREEEVEDVGIELGAVKPKARPPPPKEVELSDLFADVTIKQQPQGKPPKPKDFDPFGDVFGAPSPPTTSSTALSTASPTNFSSILGSSFYNMGGGGGSGGGLTASSPVTKHSPLSSLYNALTSHTPPKSSGFPSTSHRQIKPSPTYVPFFFLRGCQPSLHATILLRGSQSLSLLHRLHRVLHLSLHIAYNLQLEQALLFDTGVTFPSSTAALDQQAMANIEQARVAMQIIEEGASAPQYMTLLSSSPYVTLPPIPFYPSLLNYRCTFPLPLPAHLLPPPQPQPSPNPSAGPPRPSGGPPPALQPSSSSWAAAAAPPRDIFHTPSSSTPAFDPALLHLSRHPPAVCTGLLQSNLLVGSCWFTTSGQCRAPDLKQIDFYSPTDKTLADFLFSNCFDVNLKCVNPACKKDIFHHVLAYTHNDGRLLIKVKMMKPDTQPGQDGTAAAGGASGLPVPGPPARSSSSPSVAGKEGGEMTPRVMSPQLPGAGTPSPPPLALGHSPTSNYRNLPAPPQLHAGGQQGKAVVNRGAQTSTHSHTPTHAFSFNTGTAPHGGGSQTPHPHQTASSTPGSPIAHAPLPSAPQSTSPPPSNSLLTWSICKLCKHRVTPYTPLSPQSLSYSFGKYLDLTFNGRAAKSTCPTCEHSVHTDYIRYVAIGNLVACFEYEKAKPYAVVARPRVKYDRTEVMEARLLHLSTLCMLSKQVFDEFLYKVGEIEANSRSSAFKDLLQQLHAKVKHEQDGFMAFYKRHGLKVQLLAGLTPTNTNAGPAPVNPALVQSLVASGDDDPSTALFGEELTPTGPGAEGERREARPQLDTFDIHKLHRKLVLSFMEWNRMLTEMCSFIFPKGYDDGADATALPTAAPVGAAAVSLLGDGERSGGGRDLLQINTERNALKGLPSPSLSNFSSFASKDPTASPQPNNAAPKTPMTPSTSFSREPLTPTFFASLHSNSGSGLGASGPISGLAAALSANTSPSLSKSPTPPSLDATPFKSLISDMFSARKGKTRQFKPTVGVDDLIEHNPKLKDAVEELIASPLGHGHFCLPACVGGIIIPVYDDEPSSIIAYTLASVEHMQLTTPGKVEEMRMASEQAALHSAQQQLQQQQQQPHVPNGGPAKSSAAPARASGGEVNFFAFDDPAAVSSQPNGVVFYDDYVNTGGTANLFDLSSFGAAAAPTPQPAPAPALTVAPPQQHPSSMYKPAPFSLASPTPHYSPLTVATASLAAASSAADRVRLIGAVGPRSSITSPAHHVTAHPNSAWWALEKPEWAVEQCMVSGFSEKERDEGVFKHKFEDQPHHLFHTDASTQFKCTVYYAKQFHALRSYTCMGDYDFIQSLTRSEKWASTGGKSGSTFSKTTDDRYVLKYVKRTELNMFLDIAPAYFQHMARVSFHHLPSVLVKILGVYTLSWTKHNKEKLSQLDVIVMPNLFYHTHQVKIFDLKGSERNRYIKQTPHTPQPAQSPAPLPTSGSSSSLSSPSSATLPPPTPPAEESSRTLLDLNLWEYTHGLPIPVHESSHVQLRIALHNDSFFLSNLEVIDYSLLLGFDHVNCELLVGVIDYIRQYTWDKKMETGFKSMGRIAGQATPTVINPASYKQRFRQAMERYFMQTPDQCSLFRKAAEKEDDNANSSSDSSNHDAEGGRRGAAGPGMGLGSGGGGGGGPELALSPAPAAGHAHYGGAGGGGGGGGGGRGGGLPPAGPMGGMGGIGRMGGQGGPNPAHSPQQPPPAAAPKQPSKFKWGA